MLLKAAYFRLVGFGEADRIDVVALRAAVGEAPASTARSLGLPGTRNLHDLAAWANLIVTYRATRGPVYAEGGFGLTLTAQVTAIRSGGARPCGITRTLRTSTSSTA